MSDIVEMLRTPTGCVPPSKWELAGAKEIERLREALRQITLDGPIWRAQRIAREALSTPKS